MGVPTLDGTSLVTIIGALIGGYAAGVVPAAWLVARHRHGIDLRDHGRGGTSAIDALVVVGPRTATIGAILEALKGGVVGLVAAATVGRSWIVATAIAGCVVGDAFPLGFRRGGRGLVPLISGLLVALPAAGAVTALLAIPGAIYSRMRGFRYVIVVAISIPTGMVLGTDDWLTLMPALIIVAALLASDLRRRRSHASPPVPRRVATARVIDHDDVRRP